MAFKTSKRDIVTMAVISAGYLLLSHLLIGFKTDQIVLLGIINGLFFATSVTRKLLLSFAAFVVFWVVFDYMKAFPNYWVNDVHIESLYNWEKALFGIRCDGAILTPNEYCARHTHVVLDVLSGLFYLSWVPVPIGLTMWFFFRRKAEAVHLSFTFLLVNLVGFVLYYLYPAAPPWYVQDYGFEFQMSTPGSAAGLIRFDQALGIHLFQSMYEKSSNVFAAMPSLHSAYPLIALFYALRNKLRIGSIFIALSVVGIWGAAVYSCHHYVLDVIGGIVCAILGIILYWTLYHRAGFFRRFTDRYILKLE